MSYPLASIRILDLSRVLAGPYAGRMLTDLGAEVVKIEPPGGDISRLWGVGAAGVASYYLCQNVGKRSMCVDLTAEGGPQLVARLALQADIVIENFRPGVMKQFGLDYATLSARNPRMIMLSISGFGQEGPEAQRPAYAAVLHAECGILERDAQEHGRPAADPALSIADMNSGLHGVVGVLAALFMRERTGRGQHIDLAMFDAMLATDDYAHFALDGLPFTRGHGNEVFDVVGGGLVISGDMRWIWHQLHHECGVPDPADPGTPTRDKIRLRRRKVLDYFASFRDRDELKRALDKANLAWGDVKTTQQALVSPTAIARDLLVPVDDGAGGQRRVLRTPYRFSDARCDVRGAYAQCGEHNQEVLREWLQMSDDEYARLSAARVLRQEAPREPRPA
jgi:CoA:oxalate CoA-transferase